MLACLRCRRHASQLQKMNSAGGKEEMNLDVDEEMTRLRETVERIRSEKDEQVRQ